VIRSGRRPLPLWLRSGFLILPLLGNASAQSPPPGTITFASLLHELADPMTLTQPQNYRAGMVSTWDRTGGNQDDNNFLKVQGRVATLADLDGPGVLTRIFAATPGGRVRIYLDHSPVPIIDLPAERLFSGQVEPFLAPLVGHEAGNWSYVPIPFARHCLVQIVSESPGPARPDFGGFWHVSFRNYPPGVKLETLTLPLAPETRAAWPQAQELGRLPFNPNSCIQHVITAPAKNKKEIELFNQPGQGIIQGLSISAPEDYFLNIFWDAETSPSIAIPMPFDQIPFPMPFNNGVLMQVSCDGPCQGETITARFSSCSSDTVSDYRLHAWYHQEWTQPHPESKLSAEHNYRILRTEGQGHYVGTVLRVWNQYFIWWGEGDEMMFVDGESWPPQLHGTGTEDYFDAAWCKFGRSPFAGALVTDSLDKLYAGETRAYRWHLADPIPFFKMIDFSIEHGSNNDLGNFYSSVAFWYQKEPHAPLPPLPAYAERKWDQKKLESLVGEEYSRALLAKLGKVFRLAALGFLVLLALFPVVLFGVRMLLGKKKERR